MDRNVQNLIRFFMTALPVLLFILKKDRGMLRVRRRDIPWLFANGFASIFFFSMCYLRAIQETKIATAVALLCGILTGAGAYLLYTLGLTGMESSRAAQLATIEPVAAAIFGVVLFGQVLTPVGIAGILLLVGSVILMNRG